MSHPEYPQQQQPRVFDTSYRNATLEFIAGRKRRMAEWVTKNHPEVEVRCPWWRPDKPEDGVHLI